MRSFVKFEYYNITITFQRINPSLPFSLFLSLFCLCSRKQHCDLNESRVFHEYNGPYTQAIAYSCRYFANKKLSKRKRYFNKDREYNSEGIGKFMVNVCLV